MGKMPMLHVLTDERMTIQLGTIAAIGFDEFEPSRWLACFRELGCTVVQAYRNTSRNISLEQMRQAIAAGGMPCDSLHGIFGEEFDPSAPLEEARRFAVDTFKSEGQLCLDLGGSLVVVHCSTIRASGISPRERLLRVDQLKRSIEDLGRHGQAIGVRYAFENLPAYHPLGSDVGELAGILRQVGAPSTGICFDCGHAHMVGDVASAVRLGGDQIIYVHISDNSGKGDEHEMLTCGTIDAAAMARALRDIRYSGTMMLEVFYGLDRLRQVINDGCAKRLAGVLAIANGQTPRA
jgi:sugar phosphate isomerase/epimerase